MANEFLNKLNYQVTNKIPAWIMRQAGRYLPEYQDLRKKTNNFVELCYNKNLITEITLMPINRFHNLDAAILFSDILIIPDALGMGLEFTPGIGPFFNKALTTPADFKKFITANQDEIFDKLSPIFEALPLIKSNIGNKALIGFCGSPWTTACYLFQKLNQKPERDWQSVRKFLFIDEYQADFKLILDFLTKILTKFLNLQLKSGADAIAIFDTWGGVLSAEQYKNWCLPSLKYIKNNLKTDNIIFYSKQSSHLLSVFKKLNYKSFVFDWTVNLNYAREILGPDVILQGNLDPCILLSAPKQIQQNVELLKEQYKLDKNQNYIFNLGHGILPQTPVQNVEFLLKSL